MSTTVNTFMPDMGERGREREREGERESEGESEGGERVIDKERGRGGRRIEIVRE